MKTLEHSCLVLSNMRLVNDGHAVPDLHGVRLNKSMTVRKPAVWAQCGYASKLAGLLERFPCHVAFAAVS